MSLLGRILKAALPMKYRGLFISTAALGVLLGASMPALAASDTFNLTAERKHVPIGAGMTYNAWTYDGTVPGPVLKVRQGDEVSRVTRTESTSMRRKFRRNGSAAIP